MNRPNSITIYDRDGQAAVTLGDVDPAGIERLITLLSAYTHHAPALQLFTPQAPATTFSLNISADNIGESTDAVGVLVLCVPTPKPDTQEEDTLSADDCADTPEDQDIADTRKILAQIADERRAKRKSPTP